MGQYIAALIHQFLKGLWYKFDGKVDVETIQIFPGKFHPMILWSHLFNATDDL